VIQQEKGDSKYSVDTYQTEISGKGFEHKDAFLLIVRQLGIIDNTFYGKRSEYRERPKDFQGVADTLKDPSPDLVVGRVRKEYFRAPMHNTKKYKGVASANHNPNGENGR
jgi:hypothetical protein